MADSFRLAASLKVTRKSDRLASTRTRGAECPGAGVANDSAEGIGASVSVAPNEPERVFVADLYHYVPAQIGMIKQ